MRNITKLLVPALIGATGLFGLVPTASAHTAPAASPVTLPISSYYQMVVDAQHGHLFFSQGSTSQNGILVTDLTGKAVTTIAGQTGVIGIAISPDGSTLYAALGSGDAVTAISTTTLSQTASYALPAGDTPADVVVQSGKVWVSYNTGTAGQAAIGDIDVSAASPSFHAQSTMGGWYAAPELAADPRDSGVIVAAEPGMSPASVASFNTTVDPATVRAEAMWFPNCENEQDLAVVPGGSEFILACGAPYQHYFYRTADLSQLGSYASTNYPGSIALDANGDVAAGTTNNPYANDVYIYQANGGPLLNSYNLNSSGNLVSRGLAWLPDGSKLFAVLTQGTPTAPYSLAILASPKVTPTSLSLTGPSTAYITKSLTLTGSLSGITGAPLPTGTPVTIVRSASGSAATATFQVTTSATGSFSLTDTPPAVGNYTYTASYAGSTTTAPSTATQTVAVALIPTALTLTTPSTSLVYKPTLSLTAHLGTTYTNRTVSIYAQPDGGGAKTLLKTGVVDSTGNLAVSYTAPHSTTFSAVFSGDAHYASATVAIDVIVKVKVSASLSGYYGTKTVGGITYHLYHHTKPVTISATVTPNKAGQCTAVEIQEYYSNAWQPNAISGCGTLNSSSKIVWSVDGSQADLGYQYRMRIDYSGDAANGANSSAWQYVMFES